MNLPARQSLGHALMKSGAPGEAAEVYLKDLKQYPRNGWSLFGLAQARKAEGKNDEAAEAMARFENVWQKADVSLSSSRM